MWTTWIALALADCMSGSFAVMPDVGSLVPERPELVLHAYGTHRAELRELRDEDLLLRTANGDEVPVDIVARHRGSFMDMQLVVRPEKALAHGPVELVVRGDAPTVWHDGKHRPLRWTVGDLPAPAPGWSKAPTLAEAERELMGCGPAVSATLDVDVGTPWVDVTLAPEGDEPSTGRLPVVDGKVRIGHGMCSGMFELLLGVAYTAELTAVAADGRRAEAPSVVRFVSE